MPFHILSMEAAHRYGFLLALCSTKHVLNCKIQGTVFVCNKNWEHLHHMVIKAEFGHIQGVNGGKLINMKSTAKLSYGLTTIFDWRMYVNPIGLGAAMQHHWGSDRVLKIFEP